MIRILVSIALLIFSPALAAESAEEPQYEMVEYQFVLLWPVADGPDPADPAMADVFQQHIRFLGQLSRDGRVLAAGPLIDDGRPVGGAVVLDAGSVEQAEKLLAEDPTILRGILTIEAHPLWAAKGILQPPGSFDDFTQHSFLGLLKRPIDAPEFDDETLQEMQRGHLGNMEVMHQAGELVIAGPMGDDTALRGILVFRTVERDRVLELVARDPSIKARRLEVELYEWRIFEGTLPPAPAR
jgi:uncharacterized protein YciI